MSEQVRCERWEECGAVDCPCYVEHEGPCGANGVECFIGNPKCKELTQIKGPCSYCGGDHWRPDCEKLRGYISNPEPHICDGKAACPVGCRHSSKHNPLEYGFEHNCTDTNHCGLGRETKCIPIPEEDER